MSYLSPEIRNPKCQKFSIHNWRHLKRVFTLANADLLFTYLPEGICLENSYMRQILPRHYGLKCQRCLENVLLVNLVVMS